MKRLFAPRAKPLLVSGLLSAALLLPHGGVFAADLHHVAQLRETKKCEKCDLKRADLSGAKLSRAKLSRAKLFDANSGADLSDANLSGANLSGGKLSYAVFEPAKIPLVTSLSANQGLRKLRWVTSPQGLVLLRNAFKDAGMRQQEREVT